MCHQTLIRGWIVIIHFFLVRNILGNPRCGLKNYISLPTLYDYDVKLLFCGGRKYSTATFFFFSWTPLYTNWTRWSKRDKVWSSADKLFTYVLVAVTIVVAWATSGSLLKTWSKITSLSLRSLIGLLPFLLFPNMVLAKVKIHEQSKHMRVTRFNPL